MLVSNKNRRVPVPVVLVKIRRANYLKPIMIFPDTPPGTSFPKIAPAIKPNIPPINNDHKNSASPFPPLSIFLTFILRFIQKDSKNMRQETPEKRSCNKSVQLISVEAASGTP